ncbi:6-carboxytetrahydropterin synthase [Aureimonas altamirensis]|uniref:6-pyruvoyl trahydropterin synthase family protein n=1 Tax=Aureimonas altamirensis TaxID=370622 RepID=UPI002036F239|nr:6-carboxytetrahydropterin synthase [Aureimonas altamirensis]MCM2502157.1 6-carboxytetrahydropterin synthase [Aureimonas altamirensis]
MYAVEVRDHIMIAHSLPRPVFGPAQAMHGATFVVDAAFFTDDLDRDGLAVDIGRAGDLLSSVLKPLNYANLDASAAFAGKVSTTEAIARHIFDGLAAAIADGAMGDAGAPVRRLRITLHESHVARAWYEAEL